MKKTTIPACIILVAALSACGNFEWFPDTPDTTKPTVWGSIDNKTFANTTTIYPILPAIAYLYASEPATLYYTTNIDAPITAYTTYTSTGFEISDPSWVLKFFGTDTAGNSSNILTVKFE